MEDAQALFREGVLALKEQRDVARARQLITQSLKLEPNNEMAWLWLSRTTDDPAKKLQCVERALKINPANEQALTLREKLRADSLPVMPPTPSASPKPPNTSMSVRDRIQSASIENAAPQSAPAPTFYQAPAKQAPPAVEEVRDLVTEEQLEVNEHAKTQNDKLTPREEMQIAEHLAAAEARLAADDDEGAIEQYVYALQIQVDHPQVIQRAVRQLYQMKYNEDALELLLRAIDAGTPSLSIYLTAIDLSHKLGNYTVADTLRDQVALMPSADDDTILKIVTGLENNVQTSRAMEVLEKAIETRPNSHALLMKMGDIYEAQGRKSQAMSYFDRAARLTDKKGRGRAEQALQTFTPIISDTERGSIPLALREAGEVTVTFLLLAWQDAGLNLVKMDIMHWLGIGISFIGGYFVVTAFSSPQQKGIASLFGGKVPDEPEGGSFTHQVEVKPWEDDIALPPGPLQDPTNLPILPSWARLIFALLGLAILGLAFYLVFGKAIQLLLHPVPPALPDINDFITTGE